MRYGLNLLQNTHSQKDGKERGREENREAENEHESSKNYKTTP